MTTNNTFSNEKREENHTFCKTNSQDLTEKWKKGELESGWYYVNLYSVGAVMQEYIPEHNGFGYDEKNLIQEVLAPVPTYQEYLESESHCAVYSEVNKVLKEENDNLRQLLKQCIPAAEFARDFGLAAMIKSAIGESEE